MMPLIKSFRAAGVVSGLHLVAASATDKEVVTASAATDPILGIADTFDTDATDMADVILFGPVPAVAGGNIDFGDPVTADANGRAIKAVPVPGSIVRYAGFALQDATTDDQFVVQVSPGILNTPV